MNDIRMRLGNDKADHLYESYLGSKHPFYDGTFPADSTSLFWPNQKKDLGRISNLLSIYKNENLRWIRPSSIEDGLPELWGTDGIRPHGAI